MASKDLDLLWEYHDRTKHTYESVRSGGHFLDWSNQPIPFKIYSDLAPIPLPREWPVSSIDALAAIAGSASTEQPANALDLKTLASILFHTAGVTRRRSYPGGEIYFRAAACTGALYEVELYLVSGPLPDLEAGVYHFNPADFALRKLRGGDWRPLLARATANESSITRAPMTIVCTGTYWRNAWKYQARTYRHLYWDSGTMLANLFATAAALRIPARLVMGFADEQVNPLLSLDTDREVALSLVSLGINGVVPGEVLEPVSQLHYEVMPYSRFEVDYPLIRQAHAASLLKTEEEVEHWHSRTVAIPEAKSTGTLFELKVLSEKDQPGETVEQVIRRRGSTRRFARVPISYEKLSTIVFAATQGVSTDFLNPLGTRLNDLYLIVNAVEGLPSGAYVLRRDCRSLELLKEGSFRDMAGHLGLDQALPSDASVDIFFLADLQNVLGTFGSRGYRAAQIEAGMIGGKIYLGAYALGLGATGLTFYDDDVVDFFSQHAAGKSTIFLTAVGMPAKRRLRTV